MGVSGQTGWALVYFLQKIKTLKFKIQMLIRLWFLFIKFLQGLLFSKLNYRIALREKLTIRSDIFKCSHWFYTATTLWSSQCPTHTVNARWMHLQTGAKDKVQLAGMTQNPHLPVSVPISPNTDWKWLPTKYLINHFLFSSWFYIDCVLLLQIQSIWLYGCAHGI